MPVWWWICFAAGAAVAWACLILAVWIALALFFTAREERLARRRRRALTASMLFSEGRRVR